ncbi:MAG: HD domain-containing protein [Lachnospiraceae bacterium]|nr:HD domain-containing protein [Lachnospiraceae bacterium]
MIFTGEGHMKKNIKVLVAFAVFFVLIQVGFWQVDKAVEKHNNTQVEIDIVDGKSSHESINMTMEVTKYWTDYDVNKNLLTGAQYDAKILNTGKYVFKDWTIIVYMPDEGVVDSLWNGEYVVEGDTITLTPMDYNVIVEAGKDQPYGFVCTSKNILHFNTYKVYGYFEKTKQDMPFYWVLQIIRIIWAVALVCFIVVQICLIGYKKRQRRDEKIIFQTMDTFISFIDAKDPYTHGHSQRVANYTREIAKRIDLDEETVRNYYYIALMHDCGKLLVPDSILKKPAKLTADERKVIESHTVIGADILKDFTAISGIQDGALHHHERYDGAGYPNKLKGEDIPLVARILCVADAFDAMNSDRCYRKKLPQDEIIKELKENSDKQFDSKIVQYMLDIVADGQVEGWALSE